jgi:hypothetical protein
LSIVLAILFFRYGHFSGINRKVQLTYLPHGCPKTSSEEEGMSFLMPLCFTVCVVTHYTLLITFGSSA